MFLFVFANKPFWGEEYLNSVITCHWHFPGTSLTLFRDRDALGVCLQLRSLARSVLCNSHCAFGVYSAAYITCKLPWTPAIFLQYHARFPWLSSGCIVCLRSEYNNLKMERQPVDEIHLENGNELVGFCRSNHVQDDLQVHISSQWALTATSDSIEKIRRFSACFLYLSFVSS